MSDVDDMLTAARVARASTTGPKRLVCSCGGAVTLGGLPAPTYTCGACGDVQDDLASLREATRRMEG